uniref:Putative secreted peptide n=1 Tax=Anopheles braziliensis TaxID=58242 RepID=A0A2M3ZPE6_9DIPT
MCPCMRCKLLVGLCPLRFGSARGVIDAIAAIISASSSSSSASLSLTFTFPELSERCAPGGKLPRLLGSNSIGWSSTITSPSSSITWYWISSSGC